MVLTRIFHLSDLHIRNGDNTYSRYSEYNFVFNYTINSLKNNILKLNLSFDDFIIVITGDIFHNKNVIGNYGLVVYRKFIQALSLIGRTYIISGNHDYDQSDINKPSLVYSSTFDIPNVFVLNESTSFTIDEIGISFVSIDKTLDNYRNSGRLQDLPKFPSIEGDVKYKIALFHGSFSSSKLYNGKTVDETFNPYPLEWVQDFDYVLLGDIHKRQVFQYKNKTICGYAGSLIQQNFGEDIVSHGYLIWDLYNKDIKKINVYNERGFINIKEDNNIILIRVNGKYELLLEDYINKHIEIFPKNIDIKVFSNINILNLNKILEKYNIKYCIIEKIDNINNFITGHNDNIYKNDSSVEDYIKYKKELINDDLFIEYFKPLLSPENLILLNKIIKNNELLLLDVNNYPEELHEECMKINKELSADINSNIITYDNNTTDKTLYKIKYLEWEGLLCYENKNWLNMEDLDNKIFMVKGQNGTGKSAIYDILLLAIWGDNTKKNTISSGVINHNKNNGYTIIDIEILNEKYRIIRNYSKKKTGNKLHINNTSIYKYIDNLNIEILKKDTACNNEIIKLFGTMEDFLASSMITQNVDYDILKMDYKTTLEFIDNSFDIAHIYNLYNLFNKSINKYKGLRKYVDCKKEVYEKLLIASNYSDNHEEELNEQKKLLKSLNEKYLFIKQEHKRHIEILKNIDLTINYDDIKNNIDYTILISEDIYEIKVKRFTELEYILKNANILDINDIIKFSKMYDKSLDTFEDNSEIVKPCDVSIIENENNYLKDYFSIYDNDIYNDKKKYDIETLNKLRQEYNEFDILIKSLITERPLKVDKIDKPNRAKNECLNKINNIFGNMDSLNKVIEDIEIFGNIYRTSNNKIQIDENDLSIDSYNKFLLDRDNIDDEIKELNIKLENVEENINMYLIEQQKLKVKNKPIETCILDINKYKNSSQILKDIKNIDYANIIKYLEENEKYVDEYKYNNDIIVDINNNKAKYVDELMMIETNEDYHYNPDCEYCCKRSWVNRIKELRIIIEKYDDDIMKFKNNINNDINYEEISSDVDKYKHIVEKYKLLHEYYDYIKYKEAFDRINENIKGAIEDKRVYNEIINSKINALKDLDSKIIIYYNKAVELKERINNIKKYIIFKKWEENYNDKICKFNNISGEIKDIEYVLNYNNNIKPRIISHRILLKKYNKWLSYNNNKNIIISKEYVDTKRLIENYKNYKIYKNYKENLPKIAIMNDLNKNIKDIEDEIKILNDNIIERDAVYNYNKSNITKLIALRDILNNIDNTLKTLETIIINFQNFRINLYENIILKKLLENTNNMLKNVCHKLTKPFELDYMINVHRDIIHITWMIKNVDTNSKTKQIISVNQASGFQKFAISLALRLCLLCNNKKICEQLYIDEGFVSFDKYNLSIVPSFLKSLLYCFTTIIIVSHIDLIQDSIDENESIVEIKYKSNPSLSSITYKNYMLPQCK